MKNNMLDNNTLDNVFYIYLIYPISRDDEVNFYRVLKNYTNIGTEIQAYLLDWEKMEYIDENIPFPKSYLYVPADHELFIRRAYQDRLLTKEQISTINCQIIKNTDLVILFGDFSVSSDIITEINYAKRAQVPIYSMPDLSPMAIDALKLAIKLIVKAGD